MDFAKPINALKKHKNGAYCLLFATAATGLGVISYGAAHNLNLPVVFTTAATVPVLGVISYRQLKEWWHKESNFLKEQGAGYFIGQISGLSGGLSVTSAALAYHGTTNSDAAMIGGGSAMTIIFGSAAIGLLWKGDTFLKKLGKIKTVQKTGLVSENMRYSKAMASFTAARRFIKTLAYASIIAGGVWLGADSDDPPKNSEQNIQQNISIP